MTLVGGMGTVFGPIVGAGIIVAMQNYLSGFGEWVLVIQGAMFVITVLLFRRGIVGEIIALAIAVAPFTLQTGGDGRSGVTSASQ